VKILAAMCLLGAKKTMLRAAGDVLFVLSRAAMHRAGPRENFEISFSQRKRRALLAPPLQSALTRLLDIEVDRFDPIYWMSKRRHFSWFARDFPASQNTSARR
jgi:hypothetical protein